MKVKAIALSFMIFSLVLTGCSGGVSKEAKRLYNEQAEVYNGKIEYLESCLKQDSPTQEISFSYPASFMHFTDEEKEAWDSADFGEEKTKKLEEGAKIESDADSLNDTAPLPVALSDEEMAELNRVFNELKAKYKDFDFQAAKIELYE